LYGLVTSLGSIIAVVARGLTGGGGGGGTIDGNIVTQIGDVKTIVCRGLTPAVSQPTNASAVGFGGGYLSVIEWDMEGIADLLGPLVSKHAMEFYGRANDIAGGGLTMDGNDIIADEGAMLREYGTSEHEAQPWGLSTLMEMANE
jgi:hypothetical protein